MKLPCKIYAICFFALILHFAHVSHAQTLDWGVSFGSTTTDRGQSVTVDAAGNVYTAGVFSLTVDFDPGVGVQNMTSAGGLDIFVSKFDPAGNLIWAKRMGGTSQDWPNFIAVDAVGDIVLAGYYGGSVDFDPGPGVSTLTSAGMEDAFICKLDASGNLIWAKSIGGAESDFVSNFQLDPAGNIYAVGSYHLTVDFDPGAGSYSLTSAGDQDAFVVKLNGSGNFVWARSFGGAMLDDGKAVEIDDIGRVYVTGEFAGTGDFDPGAGVTNLVSAGSQDVFIVKLGNFGNMMWAYRVGGSGSDEVEDMAIDTSGNIYLSGNFNGTVDFNPGSGVANLTSGGGSDVFILKLDAAGNYQWVRQVGGGSVAVNWGLDLDSSGFVFVAGQFQGTIDMDPGVGNFPFTSGGVYDGFIDKLNSTGDFVRAIHITGAQNISCRGICAEEGKLYVAGAFASSADIDPTGGVSNLVSNGNFDPFLVKYAMCEVTNGAISPSACTNYTSPSGNYSWSISGNYSDTIPNAEGCDSIISISLTITGPSSATIHPFACANYTSPSGNYTWNAAGIYTDTIPNSIGCDSILTINLSIGNTSANISPVSCDTYTSPSGNYTWNSSGIYFDTIPNAAGCDSFLTLNLTINSVTASISANSGTLTGLPAGATYQWIDCGGLPISGATAQTFTPLASGDYAVIITQNGCTDTSACESVVLAASPERNAGIGLKGYPNPTDGHIHLEWVAGYSPVTISVRNAFGQIVQQQALFRNQQAELDIVGASGIYFVEILSENGQRGTLRIVKE